MIKNKYKNKYKNYEYYIVSTEAVGNLVPIAFVILKDGEIKRLHIEYYNKDINSKELEEKIKQQIEELDEKQLTELFFELEQLIVNENYNISKKEEHK